MVMQYEFFVPGYPMPAPRMTTKSKYLTRNQKYAAFKERIGWEAKKIMKKPFETDVFIRLEFIRLKSRKGDIDNICKSILDGLNKIAYRDDRQVRELHAKLTTCQHQLEEGVWVRIADLSTEELV